MIINHLEVGRATWPGNMIVKTFLQTQVLRLEKVGDRDVTEEELKAIVNALPLLRVGKVIQIICFTVWLVVRERGFLKVPFSTLFSTDLTTAPEFLFGGHNMGKAASGEISSI